MTDWSKHVHRFAKKNNMTYKKANVSGKCKEAYKKRKTSPRRKSPRRKTSPTRRMNNPLESYKTDTGRLAYNQEDRKILLADIQASRDELVRAIDKIKEIKRDDGDTESSRERIERLKADKAIIKKDARNLLEDLHTFDDDIKTRNDRFAKRKYYKGKDITERAKRMALAQEYVDELEPYKNDWYDNILSERDYFRIEKMLRKKYGM